MWLSDRNLGIAALLVVIGRAGWHTVFFHHYPEGKKGALTLQGDLNALDPTITLTPRQRQRSTHEILQEQYLKQRTLMNEVILRMISQSSTRPIAERADSQVRWPHISGWNWPTTALTCRLNSLSSTVRVPRCIIRLATCLSRWVMTICLCRRFSQRYAQSDVLPQSLLPTKRDYIMSSLNYIIPAFIMTFVLLVVFVITIYLIFRQKKLTDMKNDFINNMTHEFKTPISTISLAAQMLNDSSVRKSSNMLEHISNVINDETKRLRFQVEKVLQMSMFERQKATP